MTLLEIIVLAILQGLTEFLPISSSGHLILVPALLGWPDQGIAFDVAVHFGTLSAVMWFFRAEVRGLLAGFFTQLSSTRSEDNRRFALLAWLIIIGTVPVGLAGILLRDWIAAELRAPLIIAATTAGFGIALWLAERLGVRRRGESDLRVADALLIGIAQALALVPGTSRSGITMTAGMMLGLRPAAAARFSFLLSIPVILLAALLELAKLLGTDVPTDWTALALGTLLSATVAYLTIKYFLKFLDRIGMLPFMLYRLALAFVIVVVLV